MNGYANYETWNAVLWIDNHEYLYNIAKFATDYEDFKARLLRKNIGDDERNIYMQTPDNVRWDDEAIDIDEVNEAVWGDE